MLKYVCTGSKMTYTHATILLFYLILAVHTKYIIKIKPKCYCMFIYVW